MEKKNFSHTEFSSKYRHEVRVEVFLPDGYTDIESSNNVDEGIYWILA